MRPPGGVEQTAKLLWDSWSSTQVLKDECQLGSSEREIEGLKLFFFENYVESPTQKTQLLVLYLDS